MMRLHPESFIEGFVKTSMQIQGLDTDDEKNVLAYLVSKTTKYTRDSDPELWETYREAAVWLNKKMYG